MKRNLIRLGIVAVVALVIAIWVGNSRRPPETSSSAQDAFLVPGLKDEINAVSRVHLGSGGGGTIVTLVRGERDWTVTEKNGYPADMQKVREFLLKLADARLVERKTSSPELYPKLGVEDLDKTEAKGVLLEIDGLKTPVKVIIGNFNGQGGDGTFVRRVGEAQSWLARGNFTPDRTAANWLKRDLVDIAAARLAEVRVQHDGKTLRVSKNTGDEENYTVADVPKGRELSSAFVANGLSSVLAGMRFDDVLPADQAAPADAKTYDATYVGFDGLVVNAVAWERDQKHYARFTATLDEARMTQHIASEQSRARSEYEAAKAVADDAAKAGATPAVATAPSTTPAATATPAPAAPSTTPADPVAEAKAALEASKAAAASGEPPPPLAVSDPVKDATIRTEALRKEVADLNTRFANWTFVIPAYKWANINKTMDDILKPLEAAKK
jgi:hypothetical protein